MIWCDINNLLLWWEITLIHILPTSEVNTRILLTWEKRGQWWYYTNGYI